MGVEKREKAWWKEEKKQNPPKKKEQKTRKRTFNVDRYMEELVPHTRLHISKREHKCLKEAPRVLIGTSDLVTDPQQSPPLIMKNLIRCYRSVSGTIWLGGSMHNVVFPITFAFISHRRGDRVETFSLWAKFILLSAAAQTDAHGWGQTQPSIHGLVLSSCCQ